MKLIIAIIPDTVTDDSSLALTGQGYRVTRIASTGGFLRRGNSTLLIGVEDDQVDNAVATLRTLVNASDSNSKGVLFVLNVAKFLHF